MTQLFSREYRHKETSRKYQDIKKKKKKQLAQGRKRTSNQQDEQQLMKMHLCLQSHKQPVPKKQDVPFDLIWRIHTYSWDERENTVLWMKLKMFDMCDHRPQPSQGQIDGQKKKKKSCPLSPVNEMKETLFVDCCWTHQTKRCIVMRGTVQKIHHK